MKLSYYAGCSLHSTASEYNASVGYVFDKLGVELMELEDWNCCGASPAHSTNHYLGMALPLRNLVLAEKAKSDLIVPCAACYNLLKVADHAVRQHTGAADAANADLEAITGAKYEASIEVRHPLEILTTKEMLQTVKAKVVHPLSGLKLVTYYGCLLSRPREVVAFDDPEHPQIMDKLLSTLGAEVRRWSYKTDCCGGALAMSRTDAVEILVAKLVTEAERAGADAIVTACPLCQVNLDTRQTKVAQTMPIFYFSELMGIAFGAPDASTWLNKHIIDPVPVLTAQAKGV